MAIDYKNIDTRGGARRTSQEDLETSRKRAAGSGEDFRDEQGVARSSNPAFSDWAKGEIESRVQRTVMGLYGDKGRYPMHVLTPHQFTDFQSTGQWEGMPSAEEYGPQSEVAEDKEYT